MILTNCPACAAPLAHDAPRCVRCHTRYCNKTCQHDHWRRGHKQICKKIHRGGNAEQYNADKKYKEAVAVAVAKCADDTKGQTCYICTQALHWKTKEGLVRGCACRGTAGFAHVSCLAEQAKILMEEAEANNLSGERWFSRWRPWHGCSQCEQDYHSVVLCALGWACWKTYVGRPETDGLRMEAMKRLASGMSIAGHTRDAVAVYETVLATSLRYGFKISFELKNNLAVSYDNLGKHKEALEMHLDVFKTVMAMPDVSRNGKSLDQNLVTSATSVMASYMNLEQWAEVVTFAHSHDLISVCNRGFNSETEVSLKLRFFYSVATFHDAASSDARATALAGLEELSRTARRVLGSSHPLTMKMQQDKEQLTWEAEELYD